MEIDSSDLNNPKIIHPDRNIQKNQTSSHYFYEHQNALNQTNTPDLTSKAPKNINLFSDDDHQARKLSE